MRCLSLDDLVLAHFSHDALDGLAELVKADLLDHRPHDQLPVIARPLLIGLRSPAPIAAQVPSVDNPNPAPSPAICFSREPQRQERTCLWPRYFAPHLGHPASWHRAIARAQPRGCVKIGGEW